jgi:hypothetical protein
MNWLRSRIRRSPKAALVLGKTVFLAGAILVVGAVFARAGLMAINEERAVAKLPPLQTLSEAFPQYPTWLVPEGPAGFSIAAVLTLVGMAMTVLASEALKGRGRGAA